MRGGKNFFIFVKSLFTAFAADYFPAPEIDGAGIYLSSDFSGMPCCGLEGPFRLLPKGIKKDRIFTI